MKKYLVLVLVLAFSVLTGFAQNQKGVHNESEEVYDVVDIMPEFPGGMEGLNNWLSQNIQYPKDAQDKKVEGRVVCQFVIMASGKINNIKVIKSVDTLLDAEAVRVISTMPDWKPGTQNGKPVNVRFILPILFKL